MQTAPRTRVDKVEDTPEDKHRSNKSPAGPWVMCCIGCSNPADASLSKSRPDPPIQLHQRSHTTRGFQHAFRRSPRYRSDGSDGLSPVPEVRSARTEPASDHPVPFFEIADQGVASCGGEEEVEEELSVLRLHCASILVPNYGPCNTRCEV
jgi:hypothetical protein